MTNKPNPYNLISMAQEMARRKNYIDSLKFYLRAGLQLVEHSWDYYTGLKIRGLDMADINGDQIDEILVASEDCHVYALDQNGQELWKFETQSWAMSVNVIDADNDGNKGIIVGADRVYVLDNKGIVKNSLNAGTDVSSLCVKNRLFEGDFLKIIAGHDDGTISAWNKNGNLLWQYKCPRRVICMLAEDINQDGKVEIIAGSEDQKIYILNDEGGLEDVFESNHWILNVDAADIYNEGYSRLVIASFEGDVHVYKHAKSAALQISQHGIMGLHLAQLLPESSSYQVILGSSDRGVSILDLNGKLLWRFNTSYGHRVLRAAADQFEKNMATVVVGAEDGLVHKYKVHLIPGLVEWIQEAHSKIDPKKILRIGLSADELKLLSTFVHVDPINREATIHNAKESLNHNNFHGAIESAIELWRNNVEYKWAHKTGGRIYALSIAQLNAGDNKYVLAGSEDGNAYAINAADGSLLWKFTTDGGVRGVSAAKIMEESENASIAVGSVDGNLYLLNYRGEPKWNFQTQDWVLFTHMQCINGDDTREILYGSDGHYVGATDASGRQLWKFKTKDRVRAVTSADIDNDNISETIIGSDDQHIYILNKFGALIKSFPVPHWVLVIRADDINNDGVSEILVGTEDGCLYVYTPTGDLIWKYETGHWIAALHTQTNPVSGKKEIVIGSADRFIYCLSETGMLLWSFETSARVRTLHTIEISNYDRGILFGSYDQNVYMFKTINSKEIDELFSDIKTKLIARANFDWEELLIEPNDSIRAFAYLHTSDVYTLVAGIGDHSSLVRTAIACALLTQKKTLCKEEIDLLGRQILEEENHQMRLLVYRYLRNLDRERALQLLKEIGVTIKPGMDQKRIVEYLQHIRYFNPKMENWIEEVISRISTNRNEWVALELKYFV